MSLHLIHFLMVERLAELRRLPGSRTTRVRPRAARLAMNPRFPALVGSRRRTATAPRSGVLVALASVVALILPLIGLVSSVPAPSA